jgi:hypothetical protein
MLFMVIERFKEPGAVAVYRRARDQGRLLPYGLQYHDDRPLPGPDASAHGGQPPA